MVSFQHQNSSIEFLIRSFSLVQDCPPISSGETVFVGLGLGDAEGVAVGLTLGDGVALGLVLGDGTGDLITTPLFQTNFFPDFIQVYLIPAEVAVAPSFVHVVPGLGAAVASGEIIPSNRPKDRSAKSFLRMYEG